VVDAARMVDAPDYYTMIKIDNAQRTNAALTLSERAGHDRHVLAYYLVQLGLAEHHADGTFGSTVDIEGQSWRQAGSAGDTYRLPVGDLDDCR
jgi:hypothetical protein